MAEAIPASYASVREHFQRVGDLEHALALMRWDEAVLMPEASSNARGQSLATLEGLLHGLRTDARLRDWLAAARAQSDELGPWEQANLREMQREHARATAVPAQLVEALALAGVRAEQAWRHMRAANDWKGFVPLLEEVVRLVREQAAALSEATGLDRYDALLDGYETGIRSSDVDRLFGELRLQLPTLIERAIQTQAAREPLPSPRGPFPIAAQRDLGAHLMQAAGVDMQRARLDVSHHPFCGGVPSDVRITTRYDEQDFVKALMGVLHESGHAKYEQGLPTSWDGQPVGRARGMAVHESQSLLLEMQVCRSREFLQFAAPSIAEAFGGSDDEGFSSEALYRLYTRVARSKIRVDADEVTYPCHIILRYGIERGLIEGTLAVADIPEAWDAGMRELLDVSTKDDHRDGCMQDVHWPSGAFGYFPTYTLGALIAAQLFQAAVRATPDIPSAIAQGNFAPLDDWLRANVWAQASLHEADPLVRAATGEPIGTSAFLAHIKKRYLS